MIATSLTDTQGIVAIAAAAVAVVALLGCAGAGAQRAPAARRAAGRAGRGGSATWSPTPAELQGAFEELREYVEEVAERLEQRLGGVERGLRGAISHRALVRYDAYNELSGHQSVSIALLDGTRSGIVLSCIHHRDQARVYAKQVHGGQRRTGALPRGGGGGAAGALPGGQRRLRRAVA